MTRPFRYFSWQSTHTVAVSAGVSDERWRNTTSSPISCFSESATASAEQPATFESHRKIRIQNSVDVPHGTVTQHASVPATTSIDSPAGSIIIDTSTSTSPPKYQASMDFGDLGPYMNNITNGIEALLRAQSSNLPTNNNNNDSNNTHPNQTTNTTLPPTTLEPQYNLILLNTTAPSNTYVLLDHHNAKVIVWTITPSRASSSSTTTNKTWIVRFVDHVMAWLPLLELLGLAAGFWKIGWWVREKRRVRGGGGPAVGERV